MQLTGKKKKNTQSLCLDKLWIIQIKQIQLLQINKKYMARNSPRGGHTPLFVHTWLFPTD